MDTKLEKAVADVMTVLMTRADARKVVAFLSASKTVTATRMFRMLRTEPRVIMSVVVGKPNYAARMEIKKLKKRGFIAKSGALDLALCCGSHIFKTYAWPVRKPRREGK